MNRRSANECASVDAGFGVLSAVVHHWPGTTEHNSYMRGLSFFSALASIFVVAFTTTGCNSAPSKSGKVAYRRPTTATYVGSGPRPLMKLELNQNGTYFAED